MHVRTPARLARLTRLGAVVACAALVPLAGCSDDSPTTGGAPRLSILLTDAPGDFEKAVVTISEIYLQGEGGRHTLLSTPVTVDLLTLADSTASLVDEAVVPAGAYSELRFVVTGGYIEVETADGGSDIFASSPSYAGLPAGAQVDGQLRMPSFAQSGLKVKLEGDGLSLESGQKIMLVDFDVAQSFGHVAGNSGAWVMHPVLTGAEIQMSGGLTVTARLADGVTMPVVNGVQTSLDSTKVMLSVDGLTGETQFLTDANADGTYEATFLYVLPGAKKVGLVAPAGVTLTTTPAGMADVTVVSDQIATLAFTVNTAVVTPPPPPSTP